MKAVALLASLFFAPLAAGTSFSYNNDMKCSEPAHVSVSSLGCGEGYTDCAFGDFISATGVLTLSEEMPESTCVGVRACFMGISFDWFCRKYDEELDLCQYLDLMSDYNECPAAGSYAFSQAIKLPGEERSLGAGWWVTVDLDVKDCDSETSFTTCSLSFDAVSSNATAYSLVSFSAIGVIAALVYTARKRKVARIDLRHEEQLVSEGQATSSFAQMRDVGVRV